MRQPWIWIFANGIPAAPSRLKPLILPMDTLLAADGGFNNLRKLGLRPDMVIGDQDSMTAADLRWIEAEEIPVQRFPSAKDETDLELAVRYACLQKPAAIRIACAFGGRLDQTLGNLFLLIEPTLMGIDTRLEDGETEAFIIIQEQRIQGKMGDIVSLIPLGEQVQGIHTKGLRYSLDGETLFPERTRGISNEMLAPEAFVRLKAGKLICVHIRRNEVQNENP